jgi:hypothetical protein
MIGQAVLLGMITVWQQVKDLRRRTNVDKS